MDHPAAIVFAVVEAACRVLDTASQLQPLKISSLNMWSLHIYVKFTKEAATYANISNASVVARQCIAA
jgi:hypothetical protein